MHKETMLFFCFFFAFFKSEDVSPLSAQWSLRENGENGACFINFYSESKEKCGRKSWARWDAGIAKNLKYRASRKKWVDVPFCEICTQWKSDVCKRSPLQGWGKSDSCKTSAVGVGRPTQVIDCVDINSSWWKQIWNVGRAKLAEFNILQAQRSLSCW